MTKPYPVPARGDRIKNGAIILDIKPAWAPDAYIALCLWTEDRQTAVGEPLQRNADPYVTWKVYPASGETLAQAGHYYDVLSDAVVDFNNRA